MIRTQIYLPKNMHAQLTFWARRAKVPMAEIVRVILERGLEKKEEFIEEGSDLVELNKLQLKGGPRDLSSRFDEYLYK